MIVAMIIPPRTRQASSPASPPAQRASSDASIDGSRVGYIERDRLGHAIASGWPVTESTSGLNGSPSSVHGGHSVVEGASTGIASAAARAILAGRVTDPVHADDKTTAATSQTPKRAEA